MMSGMADKTTPTLRGRRLAGELKKLRERSRLSQAEAARRVAMSPSKLSRIEDARTRATEDDVSALLQMYGLDLDRRTSLLSLHPTPTSLLVRNLIATPTSSFAGGRPPRKRNRAEALAIFG